MSKACNTCGVERRYKGTEFPARRLCACEAGRECSDCSKPATVVQFQAALGNMEPTLGKRSNPAAYLFFCDRDAPEDIAKTVAPAPLPKKDKALTPRRIPTYTVIFSKSSNSLEKDRGNREELQAGDVVTTYLDVGFTTRRAVEVKGLVVSLETYPGERPILVHRDKITQILREK